MIAAEPREPFCAAWDGAWAGSFGARTDIVAIVAGGEVVAVKILGQELSIASFEMTAAAVKVAGPDFSLELTRASEVDARGTYVNQRRERASALFRRR
jgi:hypothetical protein